MKELPLEKVKEMAPHVAYKFVYEKMTDEAKAAIEKCFFIGSPPEQIADVISSMVNNHGPEISEANRLFMLKAIEHHHFLWTVENETLGT